MHKTKTHAAIDAVIESRQGKGFRNHLGASIIGKPCARQIWYTFRWFKQSQHGARLLRLFDRGNLEEARFVGWLRAAGVEVRELDPITGKQFRISDHDGHFGGSLDAEMRDLPDWEPHDEWINGEFKTHSNKSFEDLKKKGVEKAKHEHFVQMQVYMHKRGTPASLYLAINKDNDEIYTELVFYQREIGEMYVDRAGKIIYAGAPPPRINDSPAFWLCRFCEYSDICHHDAQPAMNCRSCVHSRPVADAGWHCTRYDYPLSETNQHRGCATHTPFLS